MDLILQEHYDELDLGRYGIGRQWAIVLLTPRFVTSRHLVALIFAIGAHEPSLVVKVPRQPGDNGGVRGEAEVLDQLKSLGLGPAQGVPKIVGKLDVGSYTALIETAVTGDLLDFKRVSSDLDGAVEAGAEFVAAMPCTRPASANEDWYRRTITAPLNGLVSLLQADSEVNSLVQRTHEVLAPLRSEQLPAVVEHGDLSYQNVLLHSSGGLKVVDWERSRVDGLPGHDLIFFLQYLSETHEDAFSRGPQLAAFDKAFGPSGWALRPLRDHLRLRGVNPDLLPFLIIATWARSTATMAYRLAGPTTTGPEQEGTRAAVLADRDYWLWRHVVTRWSRD